MVQILECQPASCWARAMLPITRLDLVCFTDIGADALHWRGTADFLLQGPESLLTHGLLH
eukprot:1156080-Pelagomonas_calceolata.AAC.3